MTPEEEEALLAEVAIVREGMQEMVRQMEKITAALGRANRIGRPTLFTEGAHATEEG